jgi:alpha-galactosidase/6-phospho-beta-glucosidase family protein
MKIIKKELAPMVQKHIKKYIDTTNKLLKKHKDRVQASMRTKSNQNSSWWNEILIYNTKVIDCFVLKRVYDDYYFKNDSYDTKAYKKELLKIVPENKVTVGSPAQFRKWYTSREGEITV